MSKIVTIEELITTKAQDLRAKDTSHLEMKWEDGDISHLTNKRANRNVKIAKAILKYFQRHNWLADGVLMYLNGLKLKLNTIYDPESKESTGVYVNISEDKASDYLDYANDLLVCLSFDCEFYSVMNCYWESKVYGVLHDEFDNMLSELECYAELGNSWNCVIVDDKWEW